MQDAVSETDDGSAEPTAKGRRHGEKSGAAGPEGRGRLGLRRRRITAGPRTHSWNQVTQELAGARPTEGRPGEPERFSPRPKGPPLGVRGDAPLCCPRSCIFSRETGNLCFCVECSDFPKRWSK